MLSLESNKEDKAKVFGFHRSMDTVGAVLGPLIALAFLHFYPASYKTLFMLAFIPGVIAVIATLALREKKAPASVQNNIHFFSFISYFPKASTEYKKLVSGLLLFALINSSDVLLLLKMKESNIHDTAIIGAYIFYNLIFALLAFPAGIAADKLGFRRTFITGLLFFAIVYAGFSQVETLAEYAILFLLYGIYASCTEGVAKAWITHITPPEQTATAIGAYTALQSTAALIASSLAGFIWYQYGAAYAFSLTAVFAVILIFYFLQLKGGTKN
jgi:MFS family permease